MEDKIKQSHPTLHRYLFTVTTFSKLLALSMFIILPFLGFYLGMQYEQKITVNTLPLAEARITPISNATIKLTSPAGGEVWTEGKTYDIEWTSSEIKKINISAAMGGHDLGHIALGINASIGKYLRWTPLSIQ